MGILDRFRFSPVDYPKGVVIRPLPKHEQQQIDNWRNQADWYRLKLYEAWEALRGQSKGLQRQRRLIRRLQAENEALRKQITGNAGANDDTD